MREMRIGLISDIHANAVALEAVLKDMGKVDAIVCAGDIVGYYPYPNETIELLRKHNVKCVMGDHDKAVITGDTEWFNGVTADTLRWTARHLTKENLDFIKNLPDHLELDGMTIYHGHPENMKDFAFEYEPEKICGVFNGMEHSIFAFGHTHIPVLKVCGDKTVLNPGSVGQPRDGNNQASYAIWDTEKHTFDIRRVGYDFKQVQAKILAEGLPELMAERLTYGK
jgi:putative phosphoesterase